MPSLPRPLFFVLCAVPVVPSSLPSQTRVETRLAHAINEFSLDLYQRLGKGRSNLCLSPASVSTALLMAHAGARGETETEMATVLRLLRPGQDEKPVRLEGEDLQSAIAAMLERLNPKPAKRDEKTTSRRRNFFGTPAEIRVVNAAWGQEGYPFAADYVTELSGTYRADVKLVDFARKRAAAKDAINAWVARETKGKIRDLIGSGVLRPTTRLVLTNAVYFKGTWSDEFKKRNTKPAKFHPEGAESITVPTMHHTEDHGYFEDDEVQAVQMGYRGRSHAMLILLPKKAGNLSAFEKALTGARLRTLTSRLKSRSVGVALPKFKITSNLSLQNDLTEMGMDSAFDPKKADFSGINAGQEQFWISHVLHKTYIDVDETGTEAAAATVVAFLGKAASPGKPVSFRADRPFVFVLRDIRSGLVLFVGRVMDPRSR